MNKKTDPSDNQITKEEKWLMMIDSLPEWKRQYTDSAPFKRVYKAFYDLGNQKITKKKII